MPANLTPEYLQAEQAYKEARTSEEKLRCLERMLATIPKHKGTEKMRANIKRRISKTKENIETDKKKAKKGFSYKVEPEGAGQIALIGPPNAGKSALLARLTNATVEVAEYPFTTAMPAPGMMPYLDVQIQLLDLPPVCEEHTEPWVIESARGADGLAIVVDVAADDVLDRLEFIFQRMEQVKIALQRPRSPEPPFPYVGLPTIIIANKMDLPDADTLLQILEDFVKDRYDIIPCSVEFGDDQLLPVKDALFRSLDIIRVYTKEPGEEPDMGQPFTIPRGSTLLELAREIHKDFITNLKFARIWGSTKFDGQTVQRDHVLEDKDIVEFHINKVSTDYS